MKKLLAILLIPICVYAQNPHVQSPNPQALQGTNSKWVNGIAPGYYPKCNVAACTGLVLSVGPGTCFDSLGTRHAYAGGTLTMTNSATNYIYIATGNCTVSQNTTGYPTTGALPIATVPASGGNITGASLVDDRTWFGGAGGNGGGGQVTHTCYVVIGDPSSSSPTLQTTNSAPAQCGNDFGTDETVIAVSVYVDANTGATAVNPILTGGSGTSILTGAITTSAGAWVAGTVNGSPVLHSFSGNGATCPSTPCTLDANISGVDGTTRFMIMKIDVIGASGTGSTLVPVGGAANHEILYNNSGSVSGIANTTAGFVVTSNGASSTPSFQAPQVGFPTCNDSSGSGSAQVCTSSGLFHSGSTTPATSDCMTYKTTTTNSGTGLTINVNSTSAVNVAIPGVAGWTTTLTASIIPANTPLSVCYDGTNWNVQQTGTAATGGSGALTKICSLTASSSASLDFTSANCGGSNVFTSTYNEYVIKFTSLVFSTTGVQVSMLVSTNGGSTYAGSGYLSTFYYFQLNAGATNGAINSTSDITLDNVSPSGTRPALAGEINVHDPLNSSTDKQFDGHIITQSTTTWYQFLVGSVYDSASAVNAFQIKPASGNITSGTVTVYGYQK